MGVNAATGATALIFSFCNLFGMNLNYKFEGSYLAFVLVSLQGSCLPIESCFTVLVRDAGVCAVKCHWLRTSLCFLRLVHFQEAAAKPTCRCNL